MNVSQFKQPISADKQRTVRSLTPDKQQFIINTQQTMIKAKQLDQVVIGGPMPSYMHGSPNGSTPSSQGKIGTKKYSMSSNKSRLNSTR